MRTDMVQKNRLFQSADHPAPAQGFIHFLDPSIVAHRINSGVACQRL
jgi:hypothetical protein